MSRFSVGSLPDWVRLHELRSMPLPLSDSHAPDVVEDWIRALYVPTRRDEALTAAIESTMSATNRRWLAVDGVTNLGKTDIIVNFALRRSGIQNGQIPRPDTGYLHLPSVFAEADSSVEGAGLLGAVCAFAGILPARSEDQTRRKLAELLPKMGTDLLIVDDAHMLRRQNPRSTRLTDSFRSALRLPVTFVCVGAGLDNSALLRTGDGSGYESAEQLRTRCNWYPLSPLRLTDRGTLIGEDNAEFKQMMGRYAGKVAQAIPSLTFSALREDATMSELIRRAKGKHGLIFSALKDATCLALSGDHDLSPSALQGAWELAFESSRIAS